MTRDEVLKELFRLADRLTKKYSYEDEDKMWTMCCDWNREHEDEEIFMCEVDDDSNEYVNGFMIEDYVYHIND